MDEAQSVWVQVAEGRLYLETVGSGPPLLLIHGWPLDHRMFTPQIGPLSRSFEVVAYDRRGFGRSDAPADLRLELDDVDRILDRLGIESVHLLGVSQGGRIALRYASRRPKRLRSLLLQGTVVDGLSIDDSRGEQIPIAEYAALAQAGRLDEVRERWLKHPLMRMDAEHRDELRLVRDIMQGYSGADLRRFEPNHHSFSDDVLAAMSRFDRPVLLLTGAEETPARRRHAAELLHRIPDCREVIFGHSGHLSNLTEPDRYNETVIDFCREVESNRYRSAR